MCVVLHTQPSSTIHMKSWLRHGWGWAETWRYGGVQAEAELTRQFQKENFREMHVLGQFNKVHTCDSRHWTLHGYTDKNTHGDRCGGLQG